MTDQVARYFYGRLNIAANYADKREYVLQGLNGGASRETYGHVWQIVETVELTSPEGLFIHGFLVKYKRETAEEIIEPQTGQLAGVSIPNVVVAKARFYLHVESGLIAYHPVPGQIEDHQFRGQFVELFRDNHSRFFLDAWIQSIEEQYAFRDEVARMTTVTKITIRLHPSNPSTRDAWQRIDDRLHKLGVTNYRETYQTRPDVLEGKDVIADEEILSKLLMTEDGYGEAKVTGRIDGKVRTIKTTNKPVTSEAPGDEVPPNQVLESILIVARTIFSRFAK